MWVKEVEESTSFLFLHKSLLLLTDTVLKHFDENHILVSKEKYYEEIQ